MRIIFENLKKFCRKPLELGIFNFQIVLQTRVGYNAPIQQG